MVPSSGGLAPDHDYDDVAMEEEGKNEENEDVQLRKRSKLTPPVESTYSIIGEDIGGLPKADGTSGFYSRLRDQARSRILSSERGEGGDEDMGEEGVASYSSLASPDPAHIKGIHPESTYSMVIESGDRSPVMPKAGFHGNKPPSLPARPKTTYDRSNKGGARASLSSPSPTLQGEDSVSKKKFDIIMEQLRKIQVRERNELGSLFVHCIYL